MTADTVELAIGLIDRIGIEAIAPCRHAAWDRPVRECFQVDPKKLGAALNACFLVLVEPLPRRVG